MKDIIIGIIAESHEEQLGLVSNLSWFDVDALKGVDRKIAEIFSRSPRD